MSRTKVQLVGDVNGGANFSGIVTATSANVGSGITLSGTQINVGSATTIHSTGFRIGSSDLHSSGLNIDSINSLGIGTFSDAQVNTKLLIGSGTSTGTASQTLQVTGGAYVSGNVGIGTTNPGAKLTVAGEITLGRTNSVNEGGQINFNRAVDDGFAYAIDVYGNTAANSRLRFIDAAASAERVTLDRAGNFIVGTSSSTGTASQPLQVTGGAYVSGAIGIGITNPSVVLDIATSTDAHIRATTTGTIQSSILGLIGKQAGVNNEWNIVATGNGLSGPQLRFVNGGWTGSPYMQIDTSGRITMPSQVYVYATSGTVSGTPNPVSPPHYPFISYSESYDVGSNFNASTGVFTAPVSGRYMITAVWGGLTADGRTIGTLSFNGNYEEWAETSAAFDDENAARVRYMAANDTVSFGRQGSFTYVIISIWLLG